MLFVKDLRRSFLGLFFTVRYNQGEMLIYILSVHLVSAYINRYMEL